MDSMNTTELNAQIMTNASTLFPDTEGIKMVTAQVPSGMLHYTCLVAPTHKPHPVNSAEGAFKIILQGNPESDRRKATYKLLEETEKRIAKQLLKK